MRATYVSVWDDCDEVHTGCDFDPDTNTVSNIRTAEEPAGANTCTREYILLPNGDEIEKDDFEIED